MLQVTALVRAESNQTIGSAERTEESSSYFHIITKKRKKAGKSSLANSKESIYLADNDLQDHLKGIRNQKRKRGVPKKFQQLSQSLDCKTRPAVINVAGDRTTGGHPKRFTEYLQVYKDFCGKIEATVVEQIEDSRSEASNSVIVSSDILEDGQVAVLTKHEQYEEPCIIHIKGESGGETINASASDLDGSESKGLESDSEMIDNIGLVEESGDELNRSKLDSSFELKLEAFYTSKDSQSKFDNMEFVPEKSLLGDSVKIEEDNWALDEINDMATSTDMQITHLVDQKNYSNQGDITWETSKRFKCKLCKKVFATLSEARLHAKLFHSSAVYEQNLRNKTASPFFHCPECDRNFPTERGRNKHHLMIHLKNQPISCTECMQMFSTFRPMERHLRNVHDKNPEYFCEICDEEFVLGISLGHHLEISHPSDGKLGSTNHQLLAAKRKEVHCPICKKIFKSLKTLQEHHLGEHNGMAYNCNHCKIYRTKSATALKRHLAQVHKAVNLDLYTCVDCKSGYQTPQDMEEHYVCAHNRPLNHHCLLCGEKFACLEMLRFHKGLHRAFSCHFCYLGFMKEETLEEHLKTVHSNDWPKETDELFEIDPEWRDDSEFVPIMELPQVSDEKDSTSKVLEINFDGSIEVKDENITVIDNNKQPDVCKSSADIEGFLKSNRVRDLPKKVNCPVCQKLLTSKFLRTHLLSHQGSFPHKCHMCPKEYAQGTLLRKHMKNRHPNEFLKMGNKNPKKKEIQCEFCEEVFNDIFPLEDHLWEHMDEKNYQCETCGIKFGMKSNWIEHYRNHYFKEEKLCPSCGRAFKSVGFYREHSVRCLSHWKCDECGLECENSEFYRRHQKLNHLGNGLVYKCKDCDKSFVNKFNYEDHIVTHSSEKKFPCNLCDKVFKRRRPLNEHIQRNHSKVTHTCNYCSITLNSAIDLQTHKKEHLKETSCPECGVIFMSQKTLDNHIAIYHSVIEQSHVCPQCSEVFQKQIDLKIHLNTHYTIPMFVCKVSNCHKLFKKELLLRSHTARLHSHLEYFCYICLKKFLLDTDLQRHLVTHDEKSVVKCQKCKSFLHFHNGDPPFECSQCGVKMKHKHNIQKHVESLHNVKENFRDHIFVNRWKCSVCDKILLTHNSLLKHLELHTSHGAVAAEGSLVKILLSQPLHSFATSTPMESLNVWWEDLIPSLKVPLKVAANTWQCLVCQIMTNSDENMKKHLLSSSRCQETLLASLAEKLSRENLNDKITHNDDPVDKNMQYIIVNNEINSELTAATQDSFIYMEDGMQILVDGKNRNVSEFLNTEDEMIRTLPSLPETDSKLIEASQVTNNLLNSTDVFIQMKDGQLLIPGLDSGITQYHLVNEEIDDHGTTESTYEIA